MQQIWFSPVPVENNCKGHNYDVSSTANSSTTVSESISRPFADADAASWWRALFIWHMTREEVADYEIPRQLRDPHWE